MSGLSRRHFMVGASSAVLLAGCGRLLGQAQAPSMVSRVGFLIPGSPETLAPYLDVFRQGLHDLGYIEGQNMAVELGSSGGIDRLPQDAANLVRLPVDIIVVGGVPAALAAKDATSSIPIVMAGVGDPVGAGLIASLARPGGNITGLSRLAPQLDGKRLELLRDAVPTISRVAVVWNPAVPDKARQLEEVRIAAQVLGVQVQSVELHSGQGVEAAFEPVAGSPPDALMALHDVVIQEYRTQIIDYAARHRLPTMADTQGYPEAGMLMAYGPDYAVLPRRAAYYVDRILKGAKPADLPVEQPMTFEFVVNLKTAQALGITFPKEIMLQVTDVIQ